MSYLFAILPQAWRRYVTSFLQLSAKCFDVPLTPHLYEYGDIIRAICTSPVQDILAEEFSNHLEYALAYFAESCIYDGNIHLFKKRQDKQVLEILQQLLPSDLFSSFINGSVNNYSISPQSSERLGTIGGSRVLVCGNEGIKTVKPDPPPPDHESEFRISHYKEDLAFNTDDTKSLFSDSGYGTVIDEAQTSASSDVDLSDIFECSSESDSTIISEDSIVPDNIDTHITQSDTGQPASHADFVDHHLRLIPFNLSRLLKALSSRFRRLFNDLLYGQPCSIWEWRLLCSKIYETIKYIPARVIRQSLAFLKPNSVS